MDDQGECWREGGMDDEQGPPEWADGASWPDVVSRAISSTRPERESILALEEAREAGWRVDDPLGEDSSTALILAGREGKSAIIDWLLDAEADPSAFDARGKNALSYAVSGGHFAAVARLSEACPHGSDMPSQAPLGLAAQSGRLPVAGLAFLVGKASVDTLAWTIDRLGDSRWAAYPDGEALAMCQAERARRESVELGSELGGLNKKSAPPRI